MNAQEIKTLLSGNEHLRPLFNFLSERNDNKPITVDKMITATKHKIDRSDIVHVCKDLDRIGAANFIAGRRNFPSRLHFYVTPASIGKVALGQEDKLQPVQFPPAEVTNKDMVRVPDAPQSFSVQETNLGTLFILPKGATPKDAQELADYVLRTFVK